MDTEDAATGTTYPTRAISSPPTRLRARTSTHTATATGCTHRGTAISGSPATNGATCRSSAARGTTTTTSDGAGRQAWAAARHGGDWASTAARTLVADQPDIGGTRAPTCRAIPSTASRLPGRHQQESRVVNPALVARNRNAPVTIGGATVVPLRPLPSRPVVVDHTPSNGAGNQLQQGNRSTQPTSGPAAPGGGQAAPNRPGYNQNRPVAGEPTERRGPRLLRRTVRLPRPRRLPLTAASPRRAMIPLPPGPVLQAAAQRRSARSCAARSRRPTRIWSSRSCTSG